MFATLAISHSILLAAPVLLIASTALVFRYAARRWGHEKGYLLGFGFYWLFWCLLFPGLLLGGEGLLRLLVDHTPLFRLANWPAALLWIVILAVSLVMYGKQFITAAPAPILLAILPAILNGFCEEMLWRGLYV